MHCKLITCSHVSLLKHVFLCFIAEFKTPTRPARGQFRRLIPDDSPSNDPDSHQDIIWDTTSPSPIRHGNNVYWSCASLYTCRIKAWQKCVYFQVVDKGELQMSERWIYRTLPIGSLQRFARGAWTATMLVFSVQHVSIIFLFYRMED